MDSVTEVMPAKPKKDKAKKQKDWYTPKPLLFKEIECRPSEIKQKVAEFIADGYTLEKLEFEPSMYNYKLYYYHTAKTIDRIKDGEEWRDLPGDLTGLYQISSLGRLRRIKTRILSEFRGRTQVIDKNDKRVSVSLKNLYKEVFPELA